MIPPHGSHAIVVSYRSAQPTTPPEAAERAADGFGKEAPGWRVSINTHTSPLAVLTLPTHLLPQPFLSRRFTLWRQAEEVRSAQSRHEMVSRHEITEEHATVVIRYIPAVNTGAAIAAGAGSTSHDAVTPIVASAVQEWQELQVKLVALRCRCCQRDSVGAGVRSWMLLDGSRRSTPCGASCPESAQLSLSLSVLTDAKHLHPIPSDPSWLNPRRPD